MSGNSEFLGIVHDGQLQVLKPKHTGGAPRFTTIQPQEARSPESGELNLRAYEGKAILISGNDQGGWVYSSEVIDEAGPILTAVVQETFGRKGRSK